MLIEDTICKIVFLLGRIKSCQLFLSGPLIWGDTYQTHVETPFLWCRGLYKLATLKANVVAGPWQHRPALRGGSRGKDFSWNVILRVNWLIVIPSCLVPVLGLFTCPSGCLWDGLKLFKLVQMLYYTCPFLSTYMWGRIEPSHVLSQSPHLPIPLQGTSLWKRASLNSKGCVCCCCFNSFEVRTSLYCEKLLQIMHFIPFFKHVLPIIKYQGLSA